MHTLNKKIFIFLGGFKELTYVQIIDIFLLLKQVLIRKHIYSLNSFRVRGIK